MLNTIVQIVALVVKCLDIAIKVIGYIKDRHQKSNRPDQR